MDSGSHKIYRVQEFDSRQHPENFFSAKPNKVFEEDFLNFPKKNLAKALTPDRTRGKVVVDFSIGSMVSKGIESMGEKSDQPHDKVKKVKLDVQNVKEEIMKDLPPADYVTSAWLLDVKSKDQDDYIRYLRKFYNLMKPGAQLIMIGALGMSHYTVGKDKHHALTYDEDFVRKALGEAGFVIDNSEVKTRTAESDLTDYTAVMFVEAHKEKQV